MALVRMAANRCQRLVRRVFQTMTGAELREIRIKLCGTDKAKFAKECLCYKGDRETLRTNQLRLERMAKVPALVAKMARMCNWSTDHGRKYPGHEDITVLHTVFSERDD